MKIQKSKNPKKRFPEVDFLRGTAVIMMIIFHFLYDMNYFAGAGFNVSSGFWRYFAYATAGIFIFLVGVSLTLSYSRAVKEKKESRFFMKYFFRGVKIFSLGLIITLITFVFLKDGFIAFGILHFIGLSIIAAYPLIRNVYGNLTLGILLIFTGIYLAKFNFDFPWLLWLGARPENFYTFDYFPLLPWFGLVLIGIFAGNVLYKNYERKFDNLRIPDFAFTQVFCFLGRHSLLIYFIHQPILIAVLYFSGVKINL